MRKVTFIIYFFSVMLSLLCSCSEKGPEGMTPILTVNDAQSVTRYTATLSGHVSTSDNKTSITTLKFRYGSSTDMTLTATCDERAKDVSAAIENLTSGTTYYFCLEASNEYSTTQSNIHSFTTLPDSKPSVDEIKILGQGPISAILQFNIKDNGGKPVKEAGFYYQAAGGDKKMVSIAPSNDTIRTRLNGLTANTSYTVWAFAKNDMGETLGNPLTMKTNDVTLLTAAGLLRETIGEVNEYKISTLNIAGPLNGSDLRFIREMAGKDYNDADTPGMLSILNLTDAHIVSGGTSYNSSRYAAKDTIGYGLFKDCTRLTSVMLPDDAKMMEENAFKGCSSLTTLQIPTSMEKLLPSTGCTSLSTITVSEANKNYSSINGVLYDKAVTSIIWFPQGKDDTSFTLPSSIKTLGQYAFQYCKLHAIVLPASIATLPYGVFQNSTNLSSVTLGTGITLISQYCFSGCPLKELHIKANLPPIASAESFAGVSNIFSTCILYVPIGYKPMYRSSSQWGQFVKIIEE